MRIFVTFNIQNERMRYLLLCKSTQSSFCVWFKKFRNLTNMMMRMTPTMMLKMALTTMMSIKTTIIPKCIHFLFTKHTFTFYIPIASIYVRFPKLTFYFWLQTIWYSEKQAIYLVFTKCPGLSPSLLFSSSVSTHILEDDHHQHPQSTSSLSPSRSLALLDGLGPGPGSRAERRPLYFCIIHGGGGLAMLKCKSSSFFSYLPLLLHNRTEHNNIHLPHSKIKKVLKSEIRKRKLNPKPKPSLDLSDFWRSYK